MAVSKMAAVLRLDLSMSEKFVLLKLADACDDAGRNAFPSVELIAASCGCSERTARAALRRLEKLELIEVTRKATNRFPTIYRVCPERGTQHAYFTAKDQASDSEGQKLPPNDQAESGGQNLPPTPEVTKKVGGQDLPPNTDPVSAEGQITSVRGAAPAPDPSKKEPSKVTNPGGADAPRASADPGAAIDEATPRALLEEFDRLHRAEFNGQKADIVAGKDAKTLQQLVKNHGADVVRERMRRFFKIRGDAWLQQRGYSVGMFRNVFGRFAVNNRVPAGTVPPSTPGAPPSKFSHLTQRGGGAV